MEAENFQILTWKIENFSSWNQALHGKCIESLEVHFVRSNFKMKLYPRGTSGLEEHMVIHLSTYYREDEFSGDLSFIGSNGSTLCTQRVHSNEDESDLELPPGPKFEEVIVQIRENESDHKDHLTLRLQVKNADYYEIHACTIIQVFDVTFEVDRNIILKDHLEISSEISYIRYVHDDFDIEIYLLMGRIREDKNMELHLDSNAEVTFSVKTHMSLINSVGSLIRYENNEHMFHNWQPWTFSDSLSKEELSENVRSLILHLKIISGKISHSLQNVFSYFDDIKIVPNRSHNDPANAVGVLLKELIGLYQDQEFSDLQLKCEGVTFPVHRNMLSARSPVFKTMLSCAMKEAASGCVDIADLDASTLSSFLAFLYTGSVEDLQVEGALKLYYAADKYHVPSLKRECVNSLRANVSVSNFCDVLSLGDQHRDDELTAAAHNFILKNYKEVLKSSEWNSFMCSEPLLAAKTVTDFAVQEFVGNLNPL